MIVLLSVCSAQAQQSEPSGRFELMGSISYDDAVYFPRGWDPVGSHKIHTLRLAPSIGYFFTSNVELLFDIRFNIEITDRSDEQWYHAGFALGAAYNVFVDSTIALCVGSKIGMSWPRRETYFTSRWDRPEFQFPEVFAGARFFLSENWSLNIIADYTKSTMTDESFPWDFQERTTVALGFSVLM